MHLFHYAFAAITPYLSSSSTAVAAIVLVCLFNVLKSALATPVANCVTDLWLVATAHFCLSIASPRSKFSPFAELVQVGLPVPKLRASFFRTTAKGDSGNRTVSEKVKFTAPAFYHEHKVRYLLRRRQDDNAGATESRCLPDPFWLTGVDAFISPRKSRRKGGISRHLEAAFARWVPRF